MTSGLPFSLSGNGIWKGQNKSNGQLMLLHNFHLKVSYAKLIITAALQAELTAAGTRVVPFGNGAFYDRNLKATQPNTLYAGYPTAAGAIPRLAGVLCYDPALDSLQPVDTSGVLPTNKGTIVKRGFVRYKTAKAAVAGAAISYAAITDDMCLFIENTTGDPILSVPTSLGTIDAATEVVLDSMPVLAGATYAGKIINLYPEDESVLVELDF